MRSYRKYGVTARPTGNTRTITGKIVVRPRPGRPSQGILQWAGQAFPCALGRGGIRAVKRESDGATPLGSMRLLHGYFRAGPTRPLSAATLSSPLPFRAIRAEDGWCDAPGDRNYNRKVTLPYPASSETMRRADRLYDCVIVLDYNIRPRRRGMGSAIFFHIAREGFAPTEGCVAVSARVMARLLPHLSRRTVLVVSR